MGGGGGGGAGAGDLIADIEGQVLGPRWKIECHSLIILIKKYEMS